MDLEVSELITELVQEQKHLNKAYRRIVRLRMHIADSTVNLIHKLHQAKHIDLDTRLEYISQLEGSIDEWT